MKAENENNYCRIKSDLGVDGDPISVQNETPALPPARGQGGQRALHGQTRFTGA